MAFRLARCSCSGECGKCGVSQNLSTPVLQGEDRALRKRIRVMLASPIASTKKEAYLLQTKILPGRSWRRPLSLVHYAM